MVLSFRMVVLYNTVVLSNDDFSAMHFDLITIFPKIFTSYMDESIMKRAQHSGAIAIAVHNLRDFTTDRHRTVDDTPYGGGAGMVLKIEPIFRCVTAVKKNKPLLSGREKQKSKTRTILFSAKGKRLTQQDVQRFAHYERLILICGRYEGVDERVAEHVADEEISIGDFVITGGELAAMIVVDAVTRILPGVVGNPESIVEESHRIEGYCEYPQYTKPEEFHAWRVPDVLLGGNHEAIARWRRSQAQSEDTTTDA